MAATINGVLCQELVNDFSESYDRLGGPQMRKGWLCPWANRFTVAQGFLGLSSTTSIGGLITLQTPRPYPELSTAYATHIDIQPVGPPVQGATQVSYTYAIIWVSYGCLPWTFSGIGFQQIDPLHPYIYAEQSMSFSSEWITIPGKSVYYLSTALPLLDQDWGFRSPIVNFTISLKYVPYLPAAQIIAATANPISSATYLGCAAGKLLFNGAEPHASFMSDGTYTQTVDYSFSYRPIAAWDQVYNGATEAWDKVTNSIGVQIQGRSDLSTIIPASYI